MQATGTSPDDAHIDEYDGPAGGWGSARSVTSIIGREQAYLSATPILLRQNKHGGVACVSCAWAKPKDPHPMEFCENGAKATAWEATSLRCGPDFFAQHTLAALRTWPDHDLEQAGRLTSPMRWDPDTDKYVEVDWDQAFADIGTRLQALEPQSAVFYASGRASLETSYMYQLLARIYGNNNLPDSSNMCHESTSVALPQSIGVPVGTVWLDDFPQTDCLFFFGQNVGSNSPRMLHDLQAASKRGVPIITFNPLREPGLVSFTNPQAPTEMLTGHETRISSSYLQVKVGGDIAALTGLCKTVIDADDLALATGAPRVIDAAFVEQHTQGYERFADAMRAASWPAIEAAGGLRRADLEHAAQVYMRSNAVIGVYGMGLTQHVKGVQNVRMLVNFLLLRGNIGKPGAGICPVRGHSNVQGQRTVGITEKPELAPLDRLAELYAFEPPRTKGLNTVETCEAILGGQVKAFIGLGGNFVRAVPDTRRIEHAWSDLHLTVQIATKLNRSHLVHGQVAYLLPCLGRTEQDMQLSGAQDVTTEDSTTFIHTSTGRASPPGPRVLSEPAIVARLALATLRSGQVPWLDWMGDYRLIRAAIAQTYPDAFHDFNQRMYEPGGFPRPNGARNREWNTETGLANFFEPESMEASPEQPPGTLMLTTIRSNDQFNTTIYGYDDRFRGVDGTRHVVFMNASDVSRIGARNGDHVSLTTALETEIPRTVGDLRIVEYDIPEGCIAAYFPECNVLIPVSHHAEESFVPAAKGIPVTVSR